MRIQVKLVCVRLCRSDYVRKRLHLQLALHLSMQRHHTGLASRVLSVPCRYLVTAVLGLAVSSVLQDSCHTTLLDLQQMQLLTGLSILLLQA